MTRHVRIASLQPLEGNRHALLSASIHEITAGQELAAGGDKRKKRRRTKQRAAKRALLVAAEFLADHDTDALSDVRTCRGGGVVVEMLLRGFKRTPSSGSCPLRRPTHRHRRTLFSRERWAARLRTRV